MTVTPVPELLTIAAAAEPEPGLDETIRPAPDQEMAVAAPLVIETAPAPEARPPLAARPAPDLTTASYVRLALGALLEALSFVQEQMRAAATGDGEADAGADAGLIDETIATVKEAFLTGGALAMAAAATGQKLARPLYGSWLFSPLRNLSGQLAQQTHAIRKQFRLISKTEAERSRRLARTVFGRSVVEVTGFLGQNQAVDDLLQAKVGEIVPGLGGLSSIDTLIQDLVGRYLDFLRQHPEQVDALVQAIADDYLAYLSEHPELVDKLIQQRGDRYLDYLHDENPEAVQELIQGQSLGLVDEMMDQVRERTVTADSLVETMFRGILRRTPREKMPEPPPEVKKQAAPARLPYRPRPRGAGEQE